MKIKKPTGKSLAGVLETGVGIVAGAKLSKGISGIIPLENRTYSKAIVLAGSILLASTMEGNDTLSKLAINATVGMAAQQGSELIDELVQPTLPESTGTGSQFLNNMFTAPALSGAKKSLGFGSEVFLAGMRQPDHRSPEFIEQPLDFATA